jgi:hypothetical protein
MKLFMQVQDVAPHAAVLWVQAHGSLSRVRHNRMVGPKNHDAKQYPPFR